MFKVALGNGVAINMIIGLPFLHDTDSVINLKDNIMDLLTPELRPIQAYLQNPSTYDTAQL